MADDDDDMGYGGLTDLHMHSVYSDGNLEPAEIVRYAASIGLKAISLTDHDTVNGLAEAVEEGSRVGVEIINGLELSTHSDNWDFHMLGYFVDTGHEGFRTQLQHFRDERLKRAERMVERLNKHGKAVTMDMVMAEAGNGSVGRPHVADAMVKAGLAHSVNQVFRDYIGYNGVAYEAKFKVSPEEGVGLIHDAGGLAFLAHPSLQMPEKAVYRMIEAGLDGIEIDHPYVAENARSFYRRLVDQYGLLSSGGSDCHGRTKPPMIGQFGIPYSGVEAMKIRRERLLGIA